MISYLLIFEWFEPLECMNGTFHAWARSFPMIQQHFHLFILGIFKPRLLTQEHLLFQISVSSLKHCYLTLKCLVLISDCSNPLQTMMVLHFELLAFLSKSFHFLMAVATTVQLSKICLILIKLWKWSISRISISWLVNLLSLISEVRCAGPGVFQRFTHKQKVIIHPITIVIHYCFIFHIFNN